MNFEEGVSRYVNKDMVYVKPDATLREVASIMAGSETDVAVVRSDKNEVIGLITAQELFDALRSYVLGKDVLENIQEDVRDIRVNELMRGIRALDFMNVCSLTGVRVCISLDENESVANAVRVLSMAGISHLLVMSEDGVSGTLCAEDLIKAFI
jgi:predicted transcriptional regulator